MISSAGSALLGVIFWGVATHLATAATVGRASAEIAAMTLLATMSQLSFGPIFERFLPAAGSRTRQFVKRAYAICCLVALAMAMGCILLGFAHNFLPRSLGWRALFVLAVVLWTIFVLQDSVLIGLRAAKWVPVENILFSVAKLAGLPLFIAINGTQGIFLAWTLPVLVAIFGVTRYLFKTAIPEQQASGVTLSVLPRTREIIMLASAQYASLIFSVISTSLVALIVIQRLGAVANAHYYLPAIISSGPTLLLWGLVTSFLVEASAEPHRLRHHANTTIRAALIVLIPSLLIGEVFAPEVLGIFGATYAADGTTLLRMLMLSLPATAITAFYSSFAWIDRRVFWLAVRELASSVVFFAVLFTFIGHLHLLAVGIASLVSSGIQGVFFLPISIRRYRQTTNFEIDEHEAGPTATANPSP
jgi:O-antigen/teichoic acid export membrane protein